MKGHVKVEGQAGKRVLVLSDSDLLFDVIEANLKPAKLQVERLEAPDLGPVSRAGFDLIVVAGSSPCSEPVVSLFKAALTHQIGQTPILIISDREFEADHQGQIYHLNFPFEPDTLRKLIVALLDRAITKDVGRPMKDLEEK